MNSLDSTPRHADFVYPKMAFEDHLFLLDREGKILGGRFALPTSPVCQNFFSLYDVPPREQDALREHARSFDSRPILLIGKKSPVLVLTHLASSTGRMLALVPTAPDLVRLLSAPARYVDSLSTDVAFSPYSSSLLQPRSEKDYQRTVVWLRDYFQPFSFRGAEKTDSDSLRMALTLRVRRIAQLSGCAVCYDFDPFGFGKVPPSEVGVQCILLFSLFLLTRRAAIDRGVGLYLCRSDDIPMVHALLRLYDTQDALPELAGLNRIFRERGMVFHAARLPADKALLNVRFSICQPNIRAQELRNAFSMFEEEGLDESVFGNDGAADAPGQFKKRKKEKCAATSFFLSYLNEDNEPASDPKNRTGGP